jgi:hypothetical protein
MHYELIDGFAYAMASTAHPTLTLAQLYRDRADSENNFDKLKNQPKNCIWSRAK